jgi:Tfp pilus assembly protein PilF
MISAELARSYAQMGQSAESIQAIETAERVGGKDYKILLVTADALRIQGKREDAMKRYSRALESSDEDRLEVRLALGRLFAEEGKPADAQQQVALGFAEARLAPTDITSAEDYLNAADILMSIHEYALAQRMYGRAQALGADDTAVAVGMANASLALGDTRSAELQLASLPEDPDRQNNYDYLVTQGNVYRGMFTGSGASDKRRFQALPARISWILMTRRFVPQNLSSRKKRGGRLRIASA